tara:strand:- start:498 stop:1250 length:753 start_codon:yes stop_codon:yes gene_type:complete
MTNNKMFFIANWKMHGNAKDIERSKYVIKLSKLKKYRNHVIVYCPPYTLIKTFFDKVKHSKILIGAQNCHYNINHGPFTGSINSKLIKSSGAKYVIIGHSESRDQGDTDLIINKKIKSALNEKLKVIFCVGENLGEKKKNLTNIILKKQIKKGLNKIKNFKDIIIAYEPVWSIGTGLIPSNSELKRNIDYIRKILNSFNNSKIINILYGGSVKPSNARNLAEIDGINGFIIGGASLKAKKFIDIIKKSIN